MHFGMKVPSLLYLEELEKNLTRINGGRFIHEKENCRQSLFFFIHLIKNKSNFDENLSNNLIDIIDKSKKLIKDHYYH